MSQYQLLATDGADVDWSDTCR